MKKLSATISAICVVLMLLMLSVDISYGQAPQSINYQAVVRDNLGAILPGHGVGMRFSIKNGPEGEILYQETTHLNSNPFGLITHGIGNGIPVVGDFSTIAWGNVNAWLEVEMDVNGGTTYAPMGESQLLSVPYALFAATGNQGPQGEPGPQGIPGAPGAMGSKGERGDPGMKGDTGDPGPQGIPGTNGNDGAPGADGAPGTNGTNGALWYTGTGEPAGTLGVINDLYLNNDNGDYYLKTAGDAWTLQGNLKGPSGNGGGLGMGSAIGNTTFWNGSSWVVNNHNLYNDGNNVGINHPNPGAKLHVSGTADTTQVNY
jgi:hypothetical protein